LLGLEIVRLPIQTTHRINTSAHQLAVPINFKATSDGCDPVSRNGNERATLKRFNEFKK
jgi:hypothetical protein